MSNTYFWPTDRSLTVCWSLDLEYDNGKVTSHATNPLKNKQFLCIAIMISITTIMILIRAVRTRLFLSTFCPCRYEQRDTNHKSICRPNYTHPQLRAARLVVSKISTYLCRSRPKRICFDEIRKTQPRFNGWTSNSHFFKIHKFSGPSLLGSTSNTHSIHSNISSAPFPVWRFIMTDNDCHKLSAWA